VKGLVEEFLRGAEAITITFTGEVSFNRWVCTVSVDGEDLVEWIFARKALSSITTQDITSNPFAKRRW